MFVHLFYPASLAQLRSWSLTEGRYNTCEINKLSSKLRTMSIFTSLVGRGSISEFQDEGMIGGREGIGRGEEGSSKRLLRGQDHGGRA